MVQIRFQMLQGSLRTIDWAFGRAGAPTTVTSVAVHHILIVWWSLGGTRLTRIPRCTQIPGFGRMVGCIVEICPGH